MSEREALTEIRDACEMDDPIFTTAASALCLPPRSPDSEIDALIIITQALEGLDQDARGRVLRWASDRFSEASSHPKANRIKTRRGHSAQLAREAIVSAGRLTPGELAEHMSARGWETPARNLERAARAAGNRVKDSNDDIRFEGGAFVYTGLKGR